MIINQCYETKNRDICIYQYKYKHVYIYIYKYYVLATATWRTIGSLWTSRMAAGYTYIYTHIPVLGFPMSLCVFAISYAFIQVCSIPVSSYLPDFPVFLYMLKASLYHIWYSHYPNIFTHIQLSDIHIHFWSPHSLIHVSISPVFIDFSWFHVFLYIPCP